jgi:hypothetical protein
MNELRARCDKAHAVLTTKRKELEALVGDYRALPEETHPMDFVNHRAKFTDYAMSMTLLIIEAQRISMQVEQESRQNYLKNFFEEKEKVENGKVASDEKAKRYAEFKSAGGYILENYAKINYYLARELKSDAQSYINEINQRIPIVKDEMFNSRQPNAIR